MVSGNWERGESGKCVQEGVQADRRILIKTKFDIIKRLCTLFVSISRNVL